MRKEVSVHIPMTIEQKRMIDNLAKARGCSVAEVLRSFIFKPEPKPVPVMLNLPADELVAA